MWQTYAFLKVSQLEFCFSEFERTSLETHNMYRRMHNVGALRLNYKMSVEAEQYAKEIAKRGSLDHSGTDDGENIASVCRKPNSLMTGREATNIWYDIRSILK